MTADHAYNIRAFIQASARFGMEATAIESEITATLPDASHDVLHALIPKRRALERLRHLSDDAQFHAETLRKLDGEDVTIRRTGDLIAEEMSRQEYLALVTVKAS